MPTDEEIKAAAKAMVLLCASHNKNNRGLPTRYDEARAALEAAENVRAQTRE